MVFPPLVFCFHLLMVRRRAAPSRIMRPIVSVAILRDAANAAPQDEDLYYAALSVAFSLSSVIRPAVCACASAADSAVFAFPATICAAIASCSAQALSR